MDHLKEEGRKKYDHHMAEFQKFLTSARQQYKTQMGITSPGLYVDPALEAPWLRAMERAQRLFDQDKNDRMKHELEVIRAHVQTVRDRYQELFRQDASERERSGRLSTSPRKNGSAFTNKPIEQRQNIFRDLSFSFSQMPEDCEFIVLSPEDVRRCRASYGEEICGIIPAAKILIMYCSLHPGIRTPGEAICRCIFKIPIRRCDAGTWHYQSGIDWILQNGQLRFLLLLQCHRSYQIVSLRRLASIHI